MSARDMTREPMLDYARVWTDKMVDIWRDRMDLYGAVRTGALRGSVAASPPSASGGGLELEFRFLLYGVWQDRGSGREYGLAARGAGGSVPYADASYRAARGLDRPRRRGPAWGGGETSGQPRRPRPWMSPSWAVSTRVLGEAVARITGEAFVAMMDGL